MEFPGLKFLSYLPLRHLLLAIFGFSILAPKAVELLDKVLMSYGKGHEASVYYSMRIQSPGNGALSASRKTWERDLNLTLDDEEWDRVRKNIQTMLREAKGTPHLI